jgi:hypothetical protein
VGSIFLDFSFSKIRIRGTLTRSPNEARRWPKDLGEEKEREKIFLPQGSLQPLERAQFGQGNPRKSKLFSLIFFGLAWRDFAGFGSIWFWLWRRRPPSDATKGTNRIFASIGYGHLARDSVNDAP